MQDKVRGLRVSFFHVMKPFTPEKVLATSCVVWKFGGLIVPFPGGKDPKIVA